MCHHRESDWYAERFEQRESDRAETEDPDYADELTGREVDDPEVGAEEVEEREVETPELADDEGERPAATPSDD